MDLGSICRNLDVEHVRSRFIQIVESLKLRPRDLGITAHYLYMIRKGIREPSKALVDKLIDILKNRCFGGAVGVVAGGGFEPPTSGL